MMNHSHSILLSNLTEEDRNALLRCGSYQWIPQEEMVVHEGQHSDMLRLVLSGVLEISSFARRSTLYAGQMIGVSNALNPGRARLTVMAREETALWVIGHDSLHSYLSAHSHAFDTFLECLKIERDLNLRGRHATVAQMLVA